MLVEDSRNSSGGKKAHFIDKREPKVARKPNKKELARQTLIEEVASYLVSNNGPDKEGGHHPINKKIKLSNLEAALKVAYQRGLDTRVKPVHFKGVFGLYSSETHIDDLIEIKANQILKRVMGKDKVEESDQIEITDPRGQSLLISQMTAAQIRAEEKVEIFEGKEVSVKFAPFFRDIFGASPINFTRRVLSVAGNKNLAKHLNSYDLPNLPKKAENGKPYLSVYRDKIIAVAIMAISKRLYDEKLPTLIRNLSYSDLAEAKYQRYGVDIKISAKWPVKSAGSMYKALRVYLEWFSKTNPRAKVFLDEKNGIRPYHLKKVGQGLLRESCAIDYGKELMIRIIANKLICKFSYNFQDMKKNCSVSELKQPFIDYVGGCPFEVSAFHIQKSRYLLKKDLQNFMLEHRDEVIGEAFRQYSQMPAKLQKKYKWNSSVAA